MKCIALLILLTLRAAGSPLGILLTSIAKDQGERRLHAKCSELEKSLKASIESNEFVELDPTKPTEQKSLNTFKLKCVNDYKIDVNLVIDSYSTQFELEMEKEKTPKDNDEKAAIDNFCYEFRSRFGENGYTFYECLEVTVEEGATGDAAAAPYAAVIDIEMKKMIKYIKDSIKSRTKISHVVGFTKALFAAELGTEVKVEELGDAKEKQVDDGRLLVVSNPKTGMQFEYSVNFQNDNSVLLRLRSRLGTKEIIISRFREDGSSNDEEIQKVLAAAYESEVKHFLAELVKQTKEGTVESIGLPAFVKLVHTHLQDETADVPATKDGTGEKDILALDFQKTLARPPVSLDTLEDTSSSNGSGFESITPYHFFGILASDSNNKGLNFGPFFDRPKASKIQISLNELFCGQLSEPCTVDKPREKNPQVTEAIFNSVATAGSHLNANFKNSIELAYLIPQTYRLLFVKIWEIQTNFFDGFLIRYLTQFSSSEFLIPNAESAEIKGLVDRITSDVITHYYQMLKATLDGKKTAYDIAKMWNIAIGIVKYFNSLTAGPKLCIHNEDSTFNVVLVVIANETPDAEKPICPAKDMLLANKEDVKVFAVTSNEGNGKFYVQFWGAQMSAKLAQSSMIRFEVNRSYEYDFDQVLKGMIIGAVSRSHYPESTPPAVQLTAESFHKAETGEEAEDDSLSIEVLSPSQVHKVETKIGGQTDVTTVTEQKTRIEETEKTIENTVEIKKDTKVVIEDPVENKQQGSQQENNQNDAELQKEPVDKKETPIVQNDAQEQVLANQQETNGGTGNQGENKENVVDPAQNGNNESEVKKEDELKNGQEVLNGQQNDQPQVEQTGETPELKSVNQGGIKTEQQNENLQGTTNTENVVEENGQQLAKEPENKQKTEQEITQDQNFESGNDNEKKKKEMVVTDNEIQNMTPEEKEQIVNGGTQNLPVEQNGQIDNREQPVDGEKKVVTVVNDNEGANQQQPVKDEGENKNSEPHIKKDVIFGEEQERQGENKNKEAENTLQNGDSNMRRTRRLSTADTSLRTSSRRLRIKTTRQIV